ncbi:CLUMA_CG002753, isoform A [Clunio marinus]|uniref:CLUMA_CG002753, isoform A n=1 Tax=Clunio marinus TaxID=568069 RepID=A0A1J1HMY7_9DIPT|nr:CLUMA_CG002753, isoform A [Clunio marinus]
MHMLRSCLWRNPSGMALETYYEYCGVGDVEKFSLLLWLMLQLSSERIQCRMNAAYNNVMSSDNSLEFEP